MAFELPPLPFPKNALEPHTSAQTLEFHHGRELAVNHGVIATNGRLHRRVLDAVRSNHGQ